jgi:UDP-perosamine 4-acetyltransferase
MDVVIVGAGGHGKVVLDILRGGGAYRVAGYLDADTTLAHTEVGGVPVLGQVNLLPKLRHQKIRAAIIAIGDNRVRASYAKLVAAAGLEMISAIHPAASVSPTAQIGTNTVIAAGALVCTEVKLGDSVIVNTGAVIDHECEVGEASHICPGVVLAGRVRVGEGAFVGLGARVLPCLSIGEHAVIGAGATVIRDVPAGATVVGTPARLLRNAA